MSTATRRKAPIMYHRRLWLLAAIVALVMGVLMVQAVRLTVVQGERHLDQAQSRLSQQRWLPTWRGTIYDRRQRVLAADAPRWEVAVPWSVITGQWAEDQAVAQARRTLGRDVWRMASPEARGVAIEEFRPAWDAMIEDLWSRIALAGGVSVEVVEARVAGIRSRVERLASVVWDQQRRRHEARFGEGDGPDFKPRPIAEQVGVHAVLTDLTDVEVLPLQAYAEIHPDLLTVQYMRDRVRPQQDMQVSLDTSTLPQPLQDAAVSALTISDVASPLIGQVRNQVWESDMQRRPLVDDSTGTVDRGGYRLDDRVGARGIERAWEDTLRGSVGRLIRDRSDDSVEREPPVGGGDVHLTIDVGLQARIEAALAADVGLAAVQPWHGEHALPAGTPLAASVVVLDVPTGEILAMASTPTMADVATDQSTQVSMQPWMIRPLESLAPPGSIVKPLVLAAAVTDGLVQVDEDMVCAGHHFPDQPTVARCWIYRPKYGMATHGQLGGVEALARSCNCWFYELGDRMGVHRIASWLGWFGLDQQFDVGISAAWQEAPTEVRAQRPDAVELDVLTRQGEDRFESVMLAIGQGRAAWTPLHAANAYATLARGGRVMPPTLVRGWEPPGSHEDRRLDPRGVALALSGLEDAVSQPYGTAHHLTLGAGRGEPIFNVPGVRVAAKTGTAQAPPWRYDLNGDGDLTSDERITGLDHAWVVALVGDQAGHGWKYAIAVLVEYGGSGGRVAGPIANQVVHALRAEGYLAGAVTP